MAQHTTPRRSREDGFTLIELLIVVAMIAVIATIAFPILIRARIAANEGSAIGSMRAIHSAQALFASSCGGGGYAQSLEDLSQPPDGSTIAFIDAPYVFNGVEQSGYTMSVMAAADANTVREADDTCNGSSQDAVTAYVGERHPVTISVTGVRSFAISTQGTIHVRMDGVPINASLAGTSVLP